MYMYKVFDRYDSFWVIPWWPGLELQLDCVPYKVTKFFCTRLQKPPLQQQVWHDKDPYLLEDLEFQTIASIVRVQPCTDFDVLSFND